MNGVRPEDASPLGFNRANLPPWIVASADFSLEPRRIKIVGVREENRRLFRALDAIDDPQQRALVFNETMSVKFDLHQWRSHTRLAGKRIKNNYLRFIRGWSFDANSVEGAVLKGWVESRLGIPPVYHRGPVDPADESYMRYASDRMRGHAMASAIDAQLDLMFEYSQYELRRQAAGRLTLFRGTNEAAAQEVERRGRRERLVRLNSLCSFTLDRERASEFGDTIWRASVPVERVFLLNSLFPSSLLKGEAEVLVIGGLHWVTVC